MIDLSCDYTRGAHPAVLQALVDTNYVQAPGYGSDIWTQRAAEKICTACEAPDAQVTFLTGGTQANAVTLDLLLHPWEGVLSADSGHIATHEAGAIEFGGHKVLSLPAVNGKLSAEAVAGWCAAYYSDANHEHMVAPGAVYISQPTEYGTLYSLSELEDLRAVCSEYELRLYVDGARLAYALGSAENDVTLPDLARLADAFYIGGTKCGALSGEALVISHPQLTPHIVAQIKQHGALVAKGRLHGVQFDALFTPDASGQAPYFSLGNKACDLAKRLCDVLDEAGITVADPQTNQVFAAVVPDQAERLAQVLGFSTFEILPDGQHLLRFATDWSTTDKVIDAVADALTQIEL